MSSNQYDTDDPFVPTHTWDAKQGKYVPVAETAGSQKDFWDPAYSKTCLELAKVARNPLLAVTTILRSRFKWSNGGPVEFGNVTMRSLGFYRTDKERALRCMEVAGLIKVERKSGKTPCVTRLKVF